jgi:hypothetical protein
MPPTSNGTISGVSVSEPNTHRIDCSGRTQRSAPGLDDSDPQRIDFGHGKVWMMPGRISASTSRVGRPARSMRAV